MKKFARRCDVTGRGMNEGYVVGDGERYFSEKQHLLNHLRELDWEDADGNRSQDLTDDEDIMEFFYNEDYYYYTEWEDIDDEIYPLDSSDCYYDAEGNEYEFKN